MYSTWNLNHSNLNITHPWFICFHRINSLNSTIILFILSGCHAGPELGRDEVACQSDHDSAFTTGGGFSNIYSRPLWQAKSHDAYFASITHDPPYVNDSTESTGSAVGYFPFSRYNRMGRGYPDLSIIGKTAHYVKYLFLLPCCDRVYWIESY